MAKLALMRSDSNIARDNNSKSHQRTQSRCDVDLRCRELDEVVRRALWGYIIGIMLQTSVVIRHKLQTGATVHLSFVVVDVEGREGSLVDVELGIHSGLGVFE